MKLRRYHRASSGSSRRFTPDMADSIANGTRISAGPFFLLRLGRRLGRLGLIVPQSIQVGPLLTLASRRARIFLPGIGSGNFLAPFGQHRNLPAASQRVPKVITIKIATRTKPLHRITQDRAGESLIYWFVICRLSMQRMNVIGRYRSAGPVPVAGKV